LIGTQIPYTKETMASIQLVIPGPPRTKKNHNQLVTTHGRMRVLPSKAWRDWRDVAVLFLRQQWVRKPPISWPANCAALFYRERAIGDAVGYYQGLADILEEAGVVENDKWIESWDGSRLMKDAVKPRVEVTLSWDDR
jgi:hypothetical protein